jgi:polyisoprenoid-binding protein YceI
MTRTLRFAVASALFAAVFSVGGCKKKEEAPAAAVGEAIEEVSAKPTPSAAPSVVVGSASATVDAGPPPAVAEVLALSPANTTVGFYSAGATGSHNGSFLKHEGKLTFEPDNISASSVEVTLQIASLKTDSEKLDTHLKSPDFFDAPKMPTATFKSTSLKPVGTVDPKVGGTYTLAGNLMLHGVKRGISFPVKITVGDDLLEAKADFAINRKDFKITFDGEADYLIKDAVSLSLRIKAKRH